VNWQLGSAKLFLTFPYIKAAKKFNKHNLGLNHIAFRLISTTIKQLGYGMQKLVKGLYILQQITEHYKLN
jgi:hypothetical protein